MPKHSTKADGIASWQQAQPARRALVPTEEQVGSHADRARPAIRLRPGS